ncbi:hypothetical protein CEXT_654531 [Caerostris extrusa]|uniref:Uncharacterized protein n=1 Tax=Caerostris extrusa TaxID=172846 RepID=A0AAV4PJ36_CAEEX|nr:hypothetical protein CEXT_654531 [Caerostris extrusa]
MQQLQCDISCTGSASFLPPRTARDLRQMHFRLRRRCIGSPVPSLVPLPPGVAKGDHCGLSASALDFNPPDMRQHKVSVVMYLSDDLE